MIYRILNQVSTDFFESLEGSAGEHLEFLSSEDFNLNQFVPSGDIVSVIDFAGLITGFVAITMSKETLNNIVSPLFPHKDSESLRLQGEFLKEITNGITGTTIEILRESHPLVTGLKPKLLKGELSFPKTPCYNKLIKTSQGDVCFSVAVDYMTMDISHFVDKIKGLEVQLRESISQMEFKRDESEAHFRSKNEYLVAHSIQTNQNVEDLQGYSDMILDKRINEDQRESLDALKNVSEGLLSLIYDTFKNKSRIKKGAALDELPFNIVHLLQEVCDSIRNQEIYRNRSIVLDTIDVQHEVIGDPLKIGEVVQALVVNALEFSEVKDEIHVSLDQRVIDDELVAFEFKIHADIESSGSNLDDIYDELSGEFLYGKVENGHLIHESRTKIEAMGGCIDFRSETNSGTSFAFSLTLSRDISEGANGHIVSELNGKSILIIEPNRMQADLFRGLLQRMGISVSIINDKDKCIQALVMRTYDFVLFSDKLASLDVLDISREIKSKYGLDAPTIVTVFSDEFHAIKRDLFTLPFSAILFKPLNFGSFKRVLQICSGIACDDNLESMNDTRSERVIRSQVKIQYFGGEASQALIGVNEELYAKMGLNVECFYGFDSLKEGLSNNQKLLVLDFNSDKVIEAFKDLDFDSILKTHDFLGVIVAIARDAEHVSQVKPLSSHFDEVLLGTLGQKQVHALLRRMGY